MKTKYLFYTIMLLGIFTACTKFPSGSSDCPPVKDVYFRFKDTFATSLVDVYKQGDTLKLKHNSGTIYYFVAQKPDSGYTFKKPVTYGTCDEDNYYMQYYQIELKPTVQTLTSIFVKVFYEYSGTSTQNQFRIDFSEYYYQTAPTSLPMPPSNLYINNVVINNITYNNIRRITYAFTSPPTAYVYYSRDKGLIKLTEPNGEFYELEP